MTFNIPAHGSINWDTGGLNDSLQYVKDTAEAAETPAGAQSKADNAYNAAVSTAASDASNKANAAQAAAISAAAADATTKANAAKADAIASVGATKWQPNTAYAAGAVVQAPDGSPAQAKAAFTSGATFDATKWTAIPAVPGTLTNLALLALLAARTKTYDGSDAAGNLSWNDWTLDSAAGYLIHLKTGPNATGPAACIGIGVGDGGPTEATGILVSQKAASTGCAIKIVNAAGTTGQAIHGEQSSTTAPFAHLTQVVPGAAPVLRFVTDNIPTSGQVQALFGVGINPGRAGYVMADTGDLLWQTEVRAQGSRLVAEEQSGSANPAQVHISGAQGYYPSFRDGVTTAGSTTFTSATAAFTAADTGKAIYGPGIPAGTTITYVNATTITLSAAATQTAVGIKFTIARTGTANNPRTSYYRYSGAAGKHFSWRCGMTSTTSTTALEFVAGNGAAAPGAETPSIKALTFDLTGGNAKVGLYGSAAVAQKARIGQITDSSGGAVGTTVTAAPAAYSQTDEANFRATLAAKLNALESALSAAAGGIGVTA